MKKTNILFAYRYNAHLIEFLECLKILSMQHLYTVTIYPVLVGDNVVDGAQKAGEDVIKLYKESNCGQLVVGDGISISSPFEYLSMKDYPNQKNLINKLIGL